MINVEACYVTESTIHYYCPYCWTNSRGKKFSSNILKNGNIASFRVPTTHTHGNENESTEGNWITHRSSHCTINAEPVDIHITDETERKE